MEKKLFNFTAQPELFRIVGGRNALPGEFPYQVSLRTLENDFYCGGVIIGQSWSLSGNEGLLWKELNCHTDSILF